MVTSPYNSLLALSRLRDHADCVFPVENQARQRRRPTPRARRTPPMQTPWGARAAHRRGSDTTSVAVTLLTPPRTRPQALLDICAGIEARSAKGGVRKGSSASGVDGGGPEHAARGGKPWDGMNGIAANVLLNLTSSVRFEGSLNVDLNEITMNLVPFPRLHFLQSALSPLVRARADGGFTPRHAPAAPGRPHPANNPRGALSRARRWRPRTSASSRRPRGTSTSSSQTPSVRPPPETPALRCSRPPLSSPPRPAPRRDAMPQIAHTPPVRLLTSPRRPPGRPPRSARCAAHQGGPARRHLPGVRAAGPGGRDHLGREPERREAQVDAADAHVGQRGVQGASGGGMG